MKLTTLHKLSQMKLEKDPITVLTAYDATYANLLSKQGIDVILVGDSLGMVIQGNRTTVPVTIEQMCYHTEAVVRGNQSAFVIGDMPYMTYATVDAALDNATLLMQSGANMVKLEGGEWLFDTVAKLSDVGIPVCAHLGLTPQSVDALGGYRVQGRDEEQASQIIQDALALQEAGASMLVLECVPADLAKKITDQLSIPTIGIGAGVHTDGQVLVLYDMLGLNLDFRPKFVKDFVAEKGVETIADAISLYIRQVKERSFPTADHSFE